MFFWGFFRDYDYEKTEMENKTLKNMKNTLLAGLSRKSSVSSTKSSKIYQDFDKKLSDKKTLKVT